MSKTFCELIKCHRRNSNYQSNRKGKGLICCSPRNTKFACYYINSDGTISDLDDNDFYYRPKIAIVAALVKARKASANDKKDFL